MAQRTNETGTTRPDPAVPAAGVVAAARSALGGLLDPEHPRVLDAMARVDYLRRPPLPVLGKVAPLVPRRRHRVAVVIPLYNYQDYVTAAIESACTQEGVDVQVVVVDDRSTDDSFAVATQAAQGRPNVHVVQNAVNRGHGETFNRGWREVESDFVLRLDADDLLTPGALARYAALAEAAPGAGLVYGHFREFGDEPVEPRVGSPFGVVWNGRDWLRRLMEDDRNVVGTPAAMVRTRLMHEYGGWKSELPHSQDFEMWLRMATVSDVGRVFDCDQALRRVHAVSMSTVEQVGTVNFDAHRDGYDAWYGDVGKDLPEGPELYALARASLARRAMTVASHAYSRGRWDDYAADELVDFALEVDPSVGGQRRMAAQRALRRGLGRRMAYLPTSLAAAAAHRVDETIVLGRYRRDGL